MELGLYRPVTLSGLEVLVKSENGSDCMLSGEVPAQSPTGGPSTAHAVNGEIIAFFFLSVPPCLNARQQSATAYFIFFGIQNLHIASQRTTWLNYDLFNLSASRLSVSKYECFQMFLCNAIRPMRPPGSAPPGSRFSSGMCLATYQS